MMMHKISHAFFAGGALLALGAGLVSAATAWAAATAAAVEPTTQTLASIGQMQVRPTDWPQWGGSSIRNNTPQATNLPTHWNPEEGTNIKWKAPLGSQSYGNPVVANGKVYVGTNNGAGYIARYPSTIDLGVLLCFDEQTGKLLWQYSSPKLPTGRVHDWPLQGICAAPYADDKRVWFVTNRGEVVCVDAEGFHDGQNNGPVADEPSQDPLEADVLWRTDMMTELNVSQHNMCSCSVTCSGNILYVITGNGVDEGHLNIPAPTAPSFMALNRDTGKVLWTDNSPGNNILHGQWASPAVAVLGGVSQVLFPGGDGWLYSFKDGPGVAGKGELLWKFDANPKDSRYVLGSEATRNHLIGTPVCYRDRVYFAVGEDPEHGEGEGHLWCLDPTKRGDVSPQLVYNKKAPGVVIAPKRIQALEADQGDYAVDNPNSAVVWHFGAPYRSKTTQGGEPVLEASAEESDPEKTMHRSCGTVAIKDDILYIADFSGFFHCLDALSGKQWWSYDMLAACWSSPLIADGRVYISDEDGDIAVFQHGRAKVVINENLNMSNSVYTTSVVANNTLFIANRTHLFAIKKAE